MIHSKQTKPSGSLLHVSYFHSRLIYTLSSQVAPTTNRPPCLLEEKRSSDLAASTGTLGAGIFSFPWPDNLNVFTLSILSLRNCSQHPQLTDRSGPPSAAAAPADWLLPASFSCSGHSEWPRRPPLQAGRLLMRKLVAEELCIPWNEVHLQRTPKGKPFLASNLLSINSNYNFNVSHQGDYAVLAAEPELQVGIDIMKTDLPGSSSIPNFFHIMKRQFTETEWDVIKSMSNEWMQLDMFYRHWALKESFLKAIGVGIGFNLQRIEFNVSPLQLEIGKVYKDTKMLLDGEKEEEWTFEETRLDDNHHVAVALGKQEGFVQKDSDVRSVEPNQPQFTLLTFEDLVASGIPVTPEDSAYWDNFCSKQEGPVKQSSHSR